MLRTSHFNWVSQNKTEQTYDGDGRPVIEKRGWRGYPNTQPPSGELTVSPNLYQVWSTVLGSSLTTLTAAGGKQETKVFAGGEDLGEFANGGAEVGCYTSHTVRRKEEEPGRYCSRF